MSFVEELRWRGLIHDMMPGTEEQLNSGMTGAYVGFDPTADSLHIGNMVPIMLLMHLQRHGHKPFALVGGATGLVGDPSFKNAERQLLDVDKIQHNLNCIREQLKKFLNFDSGSNSAEIVNNYDWFKEFSFLGFIRDVGKHITVNYMMSKDSVKSRLDSGISFTEFSYQLIQGYDFFHLYKNHNVKIQMGGSDQWGNITTGTELIRRMSGGEAFALTAPLITKSDGTKFGKSEGGNVWLDAEKTSPYKFYQYWLNTSDEDAAKFIKIFTLLKKEEIDEIIQKHNEAPHLRELQKILAREITIMVHSEHDWKTALEASEILFGNSTSEKLMQLEEKILRNVMEGIPLHKISNEKIKEGINLVELLSDTTGIFPSRGECRKMLSGGGVYINKEKTADTELIINQNFLIRDKFIVIQKGKKNYYLIETE